MITHTTTIHGKCPINGAWDYYEVTVRTDAFLKCEDIEAACDQVRGKGITQEAMAEELRELLQSDCVLTVRGRHGQNIQTMIEL